MIKAKLQMQLGFNCFTTTRLIRRGLYTLLFVGCFADLPDAQRGLASLQMPNQLTAKGLYS